MTAPEITGPRIDGSTQAAENAANTAGRSRSGNARPTTTYSATITSPPPRPCTARPATNIHMFTAVPAVTSPAANTAIPLNSGASGPRRSHHCPETTIASSVVVKYAENANAYRPMPSSCRAAVGIAVFTAVASKASSSTTETMPRVSARQGPPSTPEVPSSWSSGICRGAAGSAWEVVVTSIW